MLIDHRQDFKINVRGFLGGNSCNSSFRSIQNQTEERMMNGDKNEVKYPIELFPVSKSMLMTIRLETFQ